MCMCILTQRANISANFYEPPRLLDYVLPDGTIALGDWHNGESERYETFYPFPKIGRKASK